MAEPAEQPARPVGLSGSAGTAQADRRVYVWWAVALTLLALLGVFCWTVAVPVWRVRRVVAGLGADWKSVDLDTGLGYEECAIAMEQLGGPERTAERIGRYLDWPDWLAPDKAKAVAVLARCPGRDAVRTACRMYGGARDGNVQRNATWVLSCMCGFPERIADLLDLLADPDPDVRCGAEWGLRDVGRWGKEAMRVLNGALADGRPAVRGFAAGLFADLQWTEEAEPEVRAAVPALERLAAHDDSAAVRAAASRALAKIRLP